MKRTFNFGFLTMVLAILFIFALPAHATKYEPPKTGGGDTTATGGNAAALGVGVGVGMGGAGGKGGAGGEAFASGGSGIGGGGSGVGDVDVNANSGNTYVLPAPAVTYTPMSNGGIVTKSHAVNLLVVSWSKSEQMTDPFQGGMRMIAEYERLCQFETAAMIRQRQYALLDPSYRELPAQPGVRNLTAQECAAARK